jgi:hypothetical protein
MMLLPMLALLFNVNPPANPTLIDGEDCVVTIPPLSVSWLLNVKL